tara:strand:- start:18860 stop:19042 length:183 start_codon:yes stop_codon:yes gene_type:complete
MDRPYGDTIEYLSGILTILKSMDKEEGDVQDVAELNIGILMKVKDRLNVLINNLDSVRVL